MKQDYGLLKGSRGYSINSITNRSVQFYVHIFAGKIIWKCHIEEVSAPVVYFLAKCSKGDVFNWAGYLCNKFLADFREAQEEGKQLPYIWLLLLIVLMT